MYLVYDRTSDFKNLGYMRNDVHFNQAGLNDIGKVTAQNIINLNNYSSESINNSSNEEQLKRINSNISIYPNPVNDDLLIEYSDIDCLEMTLFEISGKASKVDFLKLRENLVKLDVSRIRNGIYILRIRDNGIEMFEFRILVQH